MYNKKKQQYGKQKKNQQEQKGCIQYKKIKTMLFHRQQRQTTKQLHTIEGANIPFIQQAKLPKDRKMPQGKNT